MELVKYVYMNLRTRTDRDFFMRCQLSGMEVSDDMICRFDARSKYNYSCQEEICEAAVNEGFHWFESLKSSWMDERYTATQWSYCAALRELSETLQPCTCALLMQDDKLLRVRHYFLSEIVFLFHDFNILQLYQWESAKQYEVTPKKLAQGSLIPLPPRPLELSNQSDLFYKGVHRPGDSAFIVTANGAKLLLAWMEEYIYDLPEIVLYLKSGSTYVPGLYSAVDPHLFIGHISGDIVGKS